MSKRELILKSLNLIVYFAILGVAFSGHLDQDKKERDDVYLLPAFYTFQIWLLNQALLFGFVVYQWFEPANDVTVEGVSWHNVIAGTLSIIWMILAPNEKLVLLEAFILLAMFIVLFRLYDNLSLYPPRNLADRLFIHYGFTIYTAWTFYATIVNFWIALPSLNTIFSSVVAIVILGIVGLSFVDYHKRHDVVYAGTIAWALIGISVEQKDVMPILVASSISSGLIIGGILRVWTRNIVTWFRLRSERESIGERSALLA
ncbi:17624_t:CDS:2 [Entrophospora sp. SA101]|nr:13167_t:CDS:2 [Entrophospora sp. SA101]CAJ0753634.1 17624_t:CDS:2 [Entrophospora sp. SA101]CAJ0897204.1 4907_t:CDS:2 [Entrophospora sp. SA101]CAJ0912339.1 22193_t:CDS:2 [Entrophospora sp. SA101]